MKIKTMFKAVLSLAVCLMAMLVISVAVSADEYEEIEMDTEYRIENAASYSSDKITYKFNSPYKGLVQLHFELEDEPAYVIYQWWNAEVFLYDSKGDCIVWNDVDSVQGKAYGDSTVSGDVSYLKLYVNEITHKYSGSIYYNADEGYNYISIEYYDGNGSIEISHEHSYYGTVTSESTCTEKGSIKYTCDCGDSYTEEIPLKSHNEVTDHGKAATCTETGLTDGSHCSVCQKVLVVQSEIPKTNHEYNESYKVVKDATCTEKGTIRYYCVCGKAKDEEIPLTEHEAVIDEAVAATCTKEGKTQGSHCGVCNTVIIPQESVPKADHIPVTDKAVAATCIKEGKTEGSHCEICDTVIKPQETVPKADHTPVADKAIAPTCIKSGKTEGSHCSVCKKVLKEQETVAATGKHTLKHIAEKKATESSSAVQEHWKCSVCGQLFADEKGLTALSRTPVKDESPLMMIIGISVGALLLIGGAVTAIIISKKRSGKNNDITGSE